mmetsp:Transcript_7564/g.22196  ORF Transcript_7564/g.22196 Transcript_7564/m.22196 type:complete len:89 (-) Transcript_7564:549-815(-)
MACVSLSLNSSAMRLITRCSANAEKKLGVVLSVVAQYAMFNLALCSRQEITKLTTESFSAKESRIKIMTRHLIITQSKNTYISIKPLA